MRRFLVFAIYVLFAFNSKAENKIRAVNGVLDLRNRNWEKDGIAELNGDWEFYWGRFYSPDFFKENDSAIHRNYIAVPSFWNDFIPGYKNFQSGFGYATYRVKVLCPPGEQNLAIKLLTVASAYRMFVNGKEVLSVGKPDTTAAATVAMLRPSVVNVVTENNELDIVVYVSNFNNRVGGIWDFVKIGTEDQISTYTQQIFI